MKQLSVRFAQKQSLQIDDLSDKTGIDKSQIARAAMQIGLHAIRTHNDDVERSGFTMEEFIVINNLKALN
jgi:hypothetical protein